jgi:hypothetical protein
MGALLNRRLRKRKSDLLTLVFVELLAAQARRH